MQFFFIYLFKIFVDFNSGFILNIFELFTAAESDSGSDLVDVEGVDADEESDVSTKQPATLKSVTKSLFDRPAKQRARKDNVHVMLAFIYMY